MEARGADSPSGLDRRLDEMYGHRLGNSQKKKVPEWRLGEDSNSASSPHIERLLDGVNKVNATHFMDSFAYPDPGTWGGIRVGEGMGAGSAQVCAEAMLLYPLAFLLELCCSHWNHDHLLLHASSSSPLS